MRGLGGGVLAAAGLVLLAIPAIAADADQVFARNPQIAASGTDPQQIVCVRMQAEAGSHIPGGMQCHTVKDWADMVRKGADQLYLVPRDNLSSGNGTAIGGGLQH